jgi:two-component system C4-dicarboxylate transport sensor histidine kinase DctB
MLYPRRPWGVALAAALLAAIAAALIADMLLERERHALLRLALQRHAIEARALTLDGKLMGTVSLLGLVEPSLKEESRGERGPNGPEVQALLKGVAGLVQAQGMFVVDRHGLIQSSWDDTGKLATGLNVSFRPYFKTGMQGGDNVYAAVSLSRDSRALYFAAPIFPSTTRAASPVGVIVARTGMERVDRLLAGAADIALLVSPQGVVFASHGKQWQGWLSGPATPARLADIRALRQYGARFEEHQPASLPFAAGDRIVSVDGHRYAMASAPVDWNDPAGQWELVLMEDLSRSVMMAQLLPAALGSGAAAFLLCLLLLRTLSSHAAQRQASRQLEQLAHDQQASAARKMQLADLALRMQQASDLQQAVAMFLTECHRLFGALQGVVYRATGDDQELTLAGSFACASPPAVIYVGEGLLGECARARLPRMIANEAHPWTIHSGLGSSTPAAIVLAPLLLQARMLGVVELALPSVPDQSLQEHFQAAVALLAIHMQFAVRSRDAALI